MKVKSYVIYFKMTIVNDIHQISNFMDDNCEQCHSQFLLYWVIVNENSRAISPRLTCYIPYDVPFVVFAITNLSQYTEYPFISEYLLQKQTLIRLHHRSTKGQVNALVGMNIPQQVILLNTATTKYI